MNAPQNLDDMDDVDLAALSTRVLHDIVAKMTPEDRQRYRDALDAADAPLRNLLGAALGTLETSLSAPIGQPDLSKPHAFEFGRVDTDGRFSVVIEHGYPQRAKSDWPVIPLYRHPARIALEALSDASRDVMAERERQISVEGWTPQRDDRYDTGEMASAAAAYAQHAALQAAGAQGDALNAPYIETWPWSRKWWKPTTARRNLVKAGALILAEIERLDRLAADARMVNAG